MQRKWQLEQTLAANLEAVRPRGHLVALVNYNSEDGLDEFIEAKFKADIEHGSLLYFRTQEPTSFHMSIAKNLAHRLALRAGPQVLFNLDADNFIPSQTIESLEKLFAANPRSIFHNWSWDGGDGTAGRIGLSAADWVLLGGYDETLLPMTVQDVDLLFRARAIGLRYVLDQALPRPPVPNDIGQKLENLRLEKSTDARDHRLFGLTTNARIMMGENINRALNRPIVLTIAEQRRFRGVLNLSERIEL